MSAIASLERLTGIRTEAAIGDYLDSMPDNQQERLGTAFEQLGSNATEGFMQSVGAVSVAGVIGVSHRDTGIRYALNRFGSGPRLNEEPHIAVAYLHRPESVRDDDPDYQSTRAQLQDFVAKNPSARFSYFEGRENPGPDGAEPPSGRISKRVSDIASCLVHPQAGVLQTFHGGLRAMNRRHFVDIYGAHLNGPSIAVVPEIAYQRLPPHLPNMNTVLQWLGNVHCAKLIGDIHNTGVSVKTSTYRSVSGFDPAVTALESIDLVRRIAGQVQDPRIVRTCHAKMTVSGEPIVRRLQEGAVSIKDLEQPGFTGYREAYHSMPDIDTSTRDRLLREYGSPLYERAVRAAASRGVLFPAQYVTGELETLRAQLGGPDDMFNAY